ncbi:MAG: YebC/PmpR family DNA-binding transcriptional regulator, partial [Actinobacteria bacterium]|nr:YebC/PmpR family DNA-binding transcriptional regulator [Actinomycetota bacterium]
MSGHSKWATIKHKKGAADQKRAKVFAKLIRQVEVAAREGGGDPAMNPALRTMFQKARDNSVPIDTIERAIKRGTGELEGVQYEQITYEGYAPNGVAILIDVLTDNRNRTGGDVRSILKKNGGSIAEPGAVAWQFERKGIITLSRSVDEDEIMMAALDAGLEDLAEEGDTWSLTCAPSDLAAVRAALDEAGLAYESADSTMVANMSVTLETADAAKAVLRLIDALEDNDDIQDVYSNFDIADDLMA